MNGKRTVNYLYGFGDSWHHRIKVEKILAAVACPQVPSASRVPTVARRKTQVEVLVMETSWKQ